LSSITFWVALFALLQAFISIVLRWRRARDNERQQLKWLAYICAISAVTGLLAFGSGLLPISPYTGVLIGTVSIAGLTLGIPIAIGIAMLRHQLYDIDVIINRTLVYGSLTVSLALIYFGLVIAFQALVQGITGQVSLPPLAIVASTLAIAALFQPLRKRIQAIIDRRFYRRKYDAARILEAFSASLRHEVDLNQLNEQLVAIVQETMQPAHVSLWLRASSRDGTHNTQV
jgi:MFS family permease